MQTSKRICAIFKTATREFKRPLTASVIDSEQNVELKPWSDIPGPSRLPIIGQLHHFLPGGDLADLNKIQDNLYEQFGDIVRLDGVLGRPALLSLFDPEACAFVLRSENSNPVRPGFPSLEYYRKYHNKTKEQSLLSTGVITEHNENWKQFRSAVNPVMLQPKTIKLYRAALEEVANDMIERMKSLRDEDGMIVNNFNTEMNLWALESIGVVALSGRLGCFDPNLAEDSPERQLIDCVHKIFKIFNEIDFGLSFWRYVSTPIFRRAMKLYEEQEVLAKHFIDKARNKLLAVPKADEEKGILEKLLELDERMALVMANDMLFAGVDTTATFMISVLHHLGVNQSKQERLREEINTAQSTQYLRACMKEAQRLMPVVAGNMRLSTKEYNIEGYKIPKGTMIVFNHQKLCRMEKHYPRAKEYIPERWFEDGPLSHKSAHPFTYSPFGFGSRMCIGKRIAELEIETFLSKIIKNFKVEWFGPPPEIEAQSLNYFKPPFNFKFKDL